MHDRTALLPFSVKAMHKTVGTGSESIIHFALGCDDSSRTLFVCRNYWLCVITRSSSKQRQHATPYWISFFPLEMCKITY